MHTLTTITRDDGATITRFKTSAAAVSAFNTILKDADKIGAVAIFLHDQGGALDMATTLGDSIGNRPMPAIS